MGFFDHLQKGGAFSLQPNKPQIRKVVQSRSTPPSTANTPERPPRVYPSSEKRRTTTTADPGRRSASKDVDRVRRDGTTPLQPRKRQKKTPEQRLSSDDDDDDDDGGVSATDASFEVRKRAQAAQDVVLDPDRRVRDVEAFSEEGGALRELEMVHAVDVTAVQKAGKFVPAFGAESPVDVALQYPSASQRERYVFAI